MNIGGKKINTWYVVGGGVGLVLVIYLYKRSASSSSAAGSSAIDPVTGLPASEDSTIDPATGMTYLAEAQQYGSVAAAEAAVSGQYSATGQTPGGSSVLDSGFPTFVGNSSATTGNSYSSNAQWAQAVTAGLTQLGYSSTDIAAALGLYFQGMPLTSGADGVSYLSIVQAAVAEFDAPPVGTFPITGPPSSGGGVGSTGSGTGATGPAGPAGSSGGGSAAAAQVTIPITYGERADTAISNLQAAGFTVTTHPARNPATTYMSIGSSPEGGTKAAKGSHVVLNVQQHTY
jgi:hypothetical protein